MKKLLNGIKNFLKDENGLTTAEWVILASAIAMAAIAVLTIIIPRLKTMATQMENKLENYNSSDPQNQ